MWILEVHERAIAKNRQTKTESNTSVSREQEYQEPSGTARARRQGRCFWCTKRAVMLLTNLQSQVKEWRQQPRPIDMPCLRMNLPTMKLAVESKPFMKMASPKATNDG